MDTALLIGRLFFGLGIAAHGAQKLFGWFGGGGVAGTGDFFASLGPTPAYRSESSPAQASWPVDCCRCSEYGFQWPRCC